MQRDLKFPNVVYVLHKGKMTYMNNAKNPEKVNFVIVCEYGDWSGFRTLGECQQQFDELEKNGKHDGFYWVVER